MKKDKAKFKFKVGDYVEVSQKHPSSGWVGKIGQVTAFTDNDNYKPYTVTFQDGHTGYYTEKYLTLATLTVNQNLLKQAMGVK